MNNKIGIALAGGYLAIAAYLMFTQGVFGESFITLILGMPWTLGFAFFEYFGIEGGAFAYALAFAPILLNAAILYWLGSLMKRKSAPSL